MTYGGADEQVILCSSQTTLVPNHGPGVKESVVGLKSEATTWNWDNLLLLRPRSMRPRVFALPLKNWQFLIRYRAFPSFRIVCFGCRRTSARCNRWLQRSHCCSFIRPGLLSVACRVWNPGSRAFINSSSLRAKRAVFAEDTRDELHSRR